MKCFYHQDHDAVGICKSCGKGLCTECAVDMEKGLACKERCEEDVKSLIRLIQNNIRLSPTSSSIIRASKRGGLIASGFYIVLGLVFAGGGFHDDMPLITAMGGCFVIFGIISLIRVSRINSPPIQS